MSLIFLIGMPGAGKSSMARLWARSYSWNAVDMDTVLVQRHGQISALFAARGEAYFREAESRLLEELIAERPSKTIVAAGGGTPCFHHNLARMKAAGCVIYIEAAIPLLLARLQDSATIRPLLAANPEARLAELLQKREGIYRQAHFTYPAESLSEATFAEIIDTCTNRHL